MSAVLLKITNPALPAQQLYGACLARDLLRTRMQAVNLGCTAAALPWSALPGVEGLLSEKRIAAEAASAGREVLRVTTLGIAAGGRWLSWQLPGDPPPVPQ